MTKEERKEYKRKWYINNQEKAREYSRQYNVDHKEERREYKKNYDSNNPEYRKQWRINNREKTKELGKQWRINNPEYRKKWHINNPEYRGKYLRERRLRDPLFKLRCNVGTALYIAIKKGGYKKTSRTHEILGCDYEFYKHFIESQFPKDKRLRWKTYGQWHLDHIIPLSSAKTKEELIKLCHYTNTQPLWGRENLEKGCKIIQVQLKLL